MSPEPGRSGRALVGLVLLLAVACGDGEETPTAASSTTGSAPSSTAASSSTSTSSTTPTTVDAAESMVASIAATIREQAGIVTEAEAECAGRELVASVGMGRLQEVGRAAADQPGANPLELLTIEEQEAALARMRACINPATLEQLAPGGE